MERHWLDVVSDWLDVHLGWLFHRLGFEHCNRCAAQVRWAQLMLIVSWPVRGLVPGRRIEWEARVNRGVLRRVPE